MLRHLYMLQAQSIHLLFKILNITPPHVQRGKKKPIKIYKSPIDFFLVVHFLFLYNHPVKQPRLACSLLSCRSPEEEPRALGASCRPEIHIQTTGRVSWLLQTLAHAVYARRHAGQGAEALEFLIRLGCFFPLFVLTHPNQHWHSFSQEKTEAHRSQP